MKRLRWLIAAGLVSSSAGAVDRPALQLGVETGLASRRFGYVDDVFSRLRRHELDLAPMVAVSGEWYPGAHTGSALSDLGLAGRYERILVGDTEDPARGTRIETDAGAWSIGLRSRFGAPTLRWTLEADYRVRFWHLHGEPSVPNVDFRTLRWGLRAAWRDADGRVLLEPRAGLAEVVSSGDLESRAWFPRSNGYAYDLGLRLGVLHGRAVWGYLGLAFERHVLVLHPELGDLNVAGSLHDDTVSLTLGVEWSGLGASR